MADRNNDNEFISLPVFRSKEIVRNAKAIHNALNSCIQRDGFSSRIAAYRIGRVLKLDTKFCIDAIVASMSELDEELIAKVTDARVKRCAYRLAANKELLAKGQAVSYSPLRVVNHWAICEVQGFENFQYKNDFWVRIAFRVLSGPIAGRQYLTEVKTGFAKVLYGLCTGFPRKCSYVSPKDLMFLKCALALELYSDEIKHTQCAITKSLRSENVKLTRSRHRNISPCPFNAQIDCVLCPVGRNECDRSTTCSTTKLLRKPSERTQQGL